MFSLSLFLSLTVSIPIYVCLHVVLIELCVSLFMFENINKGDLHEWQLYHLTEYKDEKSLNACVQYTRTTNSNNTRTHAHIAHTLC